MSEFNFKQSYHEASKAFLDFALKSSDYEMGDHFYIDPDYHNVEGFGQHYICYFPFKANEGEVQPFLQFKINFLGDLEEIIYLVDNNSQANWGYRIYPDPEGDGFLMDRWPTKDHFECDNLRQSMDIYDSYNGPKNIGIELFFKVSEADRQRVKAYELEQEMFHTKLQVDPEIMARLEAMIRQATADLTYIPEPSIEPPKPEAEIKPNKSMDEEIDEEGKAEFISLLESLCEGLKPEIIESKTIDYDHNPALETIFERRKIFYSPRGDIQFEVLVSETLNAYHQTTDRRWILTSYGTPEKLENGKWIRKLIKYSIERFQEDTESPFDEVSTETEYYEYDEDNSRWRTSPNRHDELMADFIEKRRSGQYSEEQLDTMYHEILLQYMEEWTKQREVSNELGVNEGEFTNDKLRQAIGEAREHILLMKIIKIISED